MLVDGARRPRDAAKPGTIGIGGVRAEAWRAVSRALAIHAETHDSRHRTGVTGVAATRDAQDVRERPQLFGLGSELAGIEIQQHDF